MSNEFRIPNAFNPDLFSKEQLKAIFSVRLNKFNRLFSEIKEQPNANVPQEHLLILGERGTGKTTLLRRLQYEIEDDIELSWILPVRLNEEEYGITKLFKLWETLAELLEDKYKDFAGVHKKIDNYYLLNTPETDVFEKYAFHCIFDIVEEKQKKIILFIDNFGDMISRIDKVEQQRFREIIMQYPRLKIVAGSAVVSESFYTYQDPLFESFKMIHLTGLSEQETLDLLLNLGEFYKRPRIKTIIQTQPNRILTLHRLTGGNIRIVILLFELLVNNEESDFFRDFISVIDRLTTFYTNKINDIKGERREIVETLALNWDAMSALEVAKKIRQEGVYVSNQLNQLVTDDIVERKENEIYQLKDRFFNIWFLMRYGRKSKDKVLFLIKFFEEWLDRFESNDRARLVVKEYWQKDIDPVTFQLLATAISQLDVLTQEVRREINEALAQSETSSTTQPPPQYSLAHHTDIRKKFLANEFIDGARIVQFREDLIAAPMGLESKAKIIDSFPKLDLDKFERIWQVLKREIQKLRDYAWQNYGQQYATCGNEGQYLSIVEALFKNDLDLAIYYIQEIVDSTCEDAATRERIAELHLRIGEQLHQQNDFERTETAYTGAIRFGSVNANFKLALMYEMEDKLKNLDKAVHFYKEALRLNYSNKAENLFRVGHIYLMKKQYIGAEQCFLQSFDIKRSLPCIYNLVQIYAYLDTELHSFSKAESLLLATLNLETYANDKAGYYNSIAWLYLHYGVKKEEALINSRKAVEFNATDINFIHTLSDILLWNNCFEESFSVAEQFMYNEDFLKESDYEQLTTYFLMLCAKRQYDHLYNYFMGERGISISSKDRFRPIYFALMHLMKDTYPLEYLKMGSELEVTVNEILTKIEEMSVKYG